MGNQMITWSIDPWPSHWP